MHFMLHIAFLINSSFDLLSDEKIFISAFKESFGAKMRVGKTDASLLQTSRKSSFINHYKDVQFSSMGWTIL
jgi:hypothetical protein